MDAGAVSGFGEGAFKWIPQPSVSSAAA